VKEEQARGLFAVAGIPVSRMWKLENGYWPDGEHYDQVRKENPWWLVKTPDGMIAIGWRKRVIQIDWADTPIRMTVTEDDVTKSETMVHAYSYGKALEYLAALATMTSKPTGEPIQEVKE
jgi:hypothetical protein